MDLKVSDLWRHQAFAYDVIVHMNHAFDSDIVFFLLAAGS